MKTQPQSLPEDWTPDPPLCTIATRSIDTYPPKKGHILRRLYDMLIFALARAEARQKSAIAGSLLAAAEQRGFGRGRLLGYTEGYAACLNAMQRRQPAPPVLFNPERTVNTGPIVTRPAIIPKRPTGSLMREMGDRVGRPDTTQMEAIRLINKLHKLEQQQQGKRASTP
jgi:hypothetical protein